MSERKNLIESKIAQIDDTATNRQKEAAKLYFAAKSGDTSAKYKLQEGISTSDIPELLTPAVNVEFLAEYAKFPVVWSQIAEEHEQDDLGIINFGGFQIDTSTLPTVNDGDEYVGIGLPGVGEYGEYPAASFKTETLSSSLRKNGIRLRISWEAIRKTGNFDLIGRATREFARQAAEAEDVTLAKQFVSTAGVINTDFTTLASNPVLTLEALEAAKAAVGGVLVNGNTVTAPRFSLVTGAGLSETAKNILNITSVLRTSGSDQYTFNPGNGDVSTVAFAALDAVGNFTTSGTTAKYWFLVPQGGARPAFIETFLSGERMPLISTKDSGHFYLSGGAVPVREGSFEDDSAETRARHVVKATALTPKIVIRSNGTAS